MGSVWRVSTACLVFAAVLWFGALRPVSAVRAGGQGYGQGQGGGQGGGGSVVGTWGLVQGDGHGGQNYSWYTFTADGQYQMVSAIQGGGNNGSIVQRWGSYQTRMMNGMTQVGVRVTGGAPTQICAPGQGCTPVRNIQQQMLLTFQVGPNALRQTDGTTFQRSEIPQQLRARLSGTRNQAAVPVSPGVHGGGANPTPGNPNTGNKYPAGVGGNCDNAQQNRICSVNSGTMYTDKRGCQVCAGP